MGTVSGHGVSLEDLVTRFQSAAESLERSYRELQGRVQSLTAELERTGTADSVGTASRDGGDGYGTGA